MSIARNTQQLMMLKGEKIYHSMKTEAKSVIRDCKVKLRTHPKCFTGRYNTFQYLVRTCMHAFVYCIDPYLSRAYMQELKYMLGSAAKYI